MLSRYDIEEFSSITKNSKMISEKSLRSGWIRSVTYSVTGYAWCVATLNEVIIYSKKSKSLFSFHSKNHLSKTKTVSNANFLFTPPATMKISNSSYCIEHVLGRELRFAKTV